MPQVGYNVSDSLYGSERIHLSGRGLADNVQLRIMCHGASIVYGYGSTDGNGFRYNLRNKLVYDGNPVNMVGSVSIEPFTALTSLLPVFVFPNLIIE